MIKPSNKREKAKRSSIVTSVTGISILYIFLHLGKCFDGTPDSIEKSFTHALTSPLDIFPVDRSFLASGIICSLVVMLLMYQNFLNKRNLRPDEESGSASWNENLRKYYSKYADMVSRVHLPRLAGDNMPVRCINKCISFLEKVISFRSQKINEDTGGDKTWIYAEDQEGRRIYKHNGTKNMILSREVVMSMDTRKTLRNNNVVVIGGSGTGKSRFVMKPNILQANSSYVITDPSGELLESMGSFLKEKGYEIKVFNLVQMDHSNTYNPFAYIRNEEGVLTMINALIKNTTPKGSSTSDPFWEKAETALLQAICFYLMAECEPEEQNFNSVMKLLRCVDAGEGSEKKKSVLDVLMDELREKDPEHIALQSYAVFKSAGGGKTAQSILISCQTRLQVFNLSVIKNLTNTDNIDLKSVGDRPTALFCITPVVDTTFNFLVALLYTQLFETLYFHAETECNEIYHRGLRLPVHVRFLLDEFPNIGTIPEFPQKLATMRKYEISCTIVIQALSQLKALYKDEWDVLMGNCDTQLFLGGTDATTLDYISKKLGKETIRAKNTSRSYGRSGSSSVSLNQTGRELMQPDEIARMDNRNCIISIRGVLPFFAEKYDYPKHPNYHMTGDADKKKEFDVKNAVTTTPDFSNRISKASSIRMQAAKDKDAASQMRYSQAEYNRDVAKETAMRNRMVEESMAAEYADEPDITEEQAADAVSERYTPDNIYVTEKYYYDGYDDSKGLSSTLEAGDNVDSY